MAKYETNVGGGSAPRQKTRKTAKAGAPQPPSTLPAARVREMPEVNPEGWKGPTLIDPNLFSHDEPAGQETAPGAKDTAPGTRKNTAAAGGGGSSASAAGAAPVFDMPEEDAGARLNYESALDELERLRGEEPRYDSRYDAQIRELYEQIASRAPFRYDSGTDPLYQQYRQDYAAQGRAAMHDTMGQAAALTGGYGSSYAQSVSQQQYDAYLRRLAEVLPETYGMALEAWQAEGQELQRRYSAVSALEKSDYERYLDELGQYNRTLDRARSDADTAYERMLAGEQRAYERAADDYARRVAADERAYRRAKDAAKASSSGRGKTKSAQTKTTAAASVNKAAKTLGKRGVDRLRQAAR